MSTIRERREALETKRIEYLERVTTSYDIDVYKPAMDSLQKACTHDGNFSTYVTKDYEYAEVKCMECHKVVYFGSVKEMPDDIYKRAALAGRLVR